MAILLTSLAGCGDAPQDGQAELLSEFGDDVVYVRLILPHIMTSPTATFNIACDNVYGTNATGDWQMSNVTVSSSIALIKNKTCRLTLKQYFDGTSTFTPLNSNSPLVVTLSNTGSITTTSAFEYTDGATPTPNLQWFMGGQNGSAYALAISYASNAITATQNITPTVLSAKTMTLSVAKATAPTVTAVTVTEATLIITTVYTLTAVVSGSTGCKYIDNSGSPAPYTPSNWISVNSAYNNASAQACPVLIPGSQLLVVGNWTNLWKTGTKTLVMWANTQNGMNAYTTSNVGP